jgi:hypothetical protein
MEDVGVFLWTFGLFCVHLIYYMTLGIFCGNLAYFPPILVNFTKKNLATLLRAFIPQTDPKVDAFMSRDLDSRISRREAVAVNEWLQSDKAPVL